MEAVRENSSLAEEASSMCSSIISFLTRKVDWPESLLLLAAESKFEASESRRFYTIADIIDSLAF
jgi:hypothetical protein